jgi:hypothetical protein
MTIRIDIERVVVDQALLEKSSASAFRAALERELVAIVGTGQAVRPPDGREAHRRPVPAPVQRLARHTALGIDRAIRGAR